MKKKNVPSGSMFEETSKNNNNTPEEKKGFDEAPFDADTDNSELGEKGTSGADEMPTSFNQLISRELVKFDVVVPKVNELSKQYLPLKITSVNDEEGYNEVSKALRFIVSKRTAVEEKRKELKADSLAYGRAVDARAKEIAGMLEPIETHLKNEKQRIDDEKKRIEEEEEAKKQAAINERISILMGLGMYQTVTEFVWKSRLNPEEEETFLRINLELWSDEDFTQWVNELTTRNESEQKIIDDREAKQKEEAELAKKEAERIAKEKEDLENEKANFKRERASLRNAKLAEIGLSTISFNPYWIYVKRSGKLGIDSKMISIVHIDDVLNMDTAVWNDLFEKIKVDVAKLKEEDDAALKIEEEERKNQQEEQDRINQENQRREARNKTLLSMGSTLFASNWMYENSLLISTEDVKNLDAENWNKKLEEINLHISNLKLSAARKEARNKTLVSLGIILSGSDWMFNSTKLLNVDEVYLLNTEEWAQKIEDITKTVSDLKNKQKEESDKLAKDKLEQEEKDRKANMSDKEIYLDYINSLKAVRVPELKTKKWAGYLQTIVKTIDTFKNMN